MIATYASYVWPCYIVSAIVLVLNLWLARRSHERQLDSARRQRQMQGGAST